jgi:hypothetical protein
MVHSEVHHAQSWTRHGEIYYNVTEELPCHSPNRLLTNLSSLDNNLRLSGEDLQRANLTSVSLNDEQGGYLASLDVFHTLHCVNKIRKMYYSDYYHDPNPLADQQEHFDHCIDLLRQVIMCHGDVSLHTYSWIDELRVPWPSMQTEHQCRNWDTLMEWSEEHHIPDLTGPILTHPTLGRSFTSVSDMMEYYNRLD